MSAVLLSVFFFFSIFILALHFLSSFELNILLQLHFNLSIGFVVITFCNIFKWVLFEI